MSFSIVLIAALAASQGEFSCNQTYLSEQLEQRATADQTARQAYQKSNGSKATEAAVLTIDAENRAWFRPVLESCGWPAQSVVGEQAAVAAWLIAQHADMDPGFQRYAADKLKSAVLVGEAQGERLALLVDRNRRLQKQPQVYGMQFNIQNNAKIVFLQVEAPELLNLRRKEIGLEPFSCYVNSVTTQSKLPAEWPLGVLYDPAICNGP